jgi:hypothetical protein
VIQKAGMPYYLCFAFAWTVLGAIFLYRACTGTRTTGILTLRRSDTATLSPGQRWAKGLFGICYLGYGVAYLVLACVRTSN